MIQSQYIHLKTKKVFQVGTVLSNHTKEKSIFWNEIWKSAGKPIAGQLANLRKFTCAKYQWAIKQI